MQAALNTSNETVLFLLSQGASPNKSSANGRNALVFAIQSKCLITINLLAPWTHTYLGGVLVRLAKDKVDITADIKELVKRAAQDNDTALEGFLAAEMFGSSELIHQMSHFVKDGWFTEADSHNIWMEEVCSDSEATVSALLPLFPNPTLKALLLKKGKRSARGGQSPLAWSQGWRGQGQGSPEKCSAWGDMSLIGPDHMDKLGQLKLEGLVPYTTLLKQLHLPKAHIAEDGLECPSHCTQMESCQEIREAHNVVDLIVSELGRRSKFFEDIEVSIIGSVREGSRVFFNDEVDIHLALNHEFSQFSYFDASDQVVKARSSSKSTIADGVEHFFDENNVFQAREYFYHFVASVHSIISTLELPPGFSMLPLTTSFSPCTTCMSLGLRGLQVMRCQHKVDCEQHNNCKCKNARKCKCSDECGCKEFASPSLTWSKVGVVLHLQWRRKDGTLWTIDCDLNCPTWPTHTRYHGTTNEADNFLRRQKPVGWLEEISKLDNLGASSATPHLLSSKSWPVKFSRVPQLTCIWMSGASGLGKLTSEVPSDQQRLCSARPGNPNLIIFYPP